MTKKFILIAKNKSKTSFFYSLQGVLQKYFYSQIKNDDFWFGNLQIPPKRP